MVVDVLDIERDEVPAHERAGLAPAGGSRRQPRAAVTSSAAGGCALPR